MLDWINTILKTIGYTLLNRWTQFGGDCMNDTNVTNNITILTMESSENGEDLCGPYNSVSELMKALNDENYS